MVLGLIAIVEAIILLLAFVHIKDLKNTFDGERKGLQSFHETSMKSLRESMIDEKMKEIAEVSYNYSQEITELKDKLKAAQRILDASSNDRADIQELRDQLKEKELIIEALKKTYDSALPKPEFKTVVSPNAPKKTGSKVKPKPKPKASTLK